MEPRKHIWPIVLTALLLITMGLLIWFIADVRGLYRSGNLRPTRSLNRNYIYKETATPDQIQEWMTFSYVNYIFNLPADYLLNSLVLQDTRYPNVSIEQYAREKGLDISAFLQIVQEYVASSTKSTQ